ncbi:cytochrome P450 71AU50-like [Tripterygium wilfordii]|uniref:cytochrome P450 71AU50-like n=1 Tax=Tripterygium wilfordii TaxID=458696 RepID=UPI0018F84FE8|nr:cytochrome P450 71AU50-like [Tripterygium wilfordii]
MSPLRLPLSMTSTYPENHAIIINAWSIGRDPSAWTDAEKFIPERFEGSNVDLRGHDFKLLPFGAGRRGCPGLQLGLTMVRLMLAQMVHCFDWELPDNMLATELDMTEEFALTTPRANHLMLGAISEFMVYRILNGMNPTETTQRKTKRGRTLSKIQAHKLFFAQKALEGA